MLSLYIQEENIINKVIVVCFTFRGSKQQETETDEVDTIRVQLSTISVQVIYQEVAVIKDIKKRSQEITLIKKKSHRN